MMPADTRRFSYDVGRFQTDVLVYPRLSSLYSKYRLVAIVGTSLVFSIHLRIYIVPSHLLSKLAVKALSIFESLLLTHLEPP